MGATRARGSRRVDRPQDVCAAHCARHEARRAQSTKKSDTVGELLEQWCASAVVDLAKGALLIERSIVENGKGELIEKDTKTHAARRLRLDAGTVERLREHRAEREGYGTELRRIVHADDFVFSHDPAGRAPWRPGYVTLAFCRLRDDLDLSGVRLHDLRHFAATILLSGGKDVKTVSGRLGHANAATTLGVYAHFIEAADEDAAAHLGATLDGAASRNTVQLAVRMVAVGGPVGCGQL